MTAVNFLTFIRRFRSLPAHQQAAVADLVESLGQSASTSRIPASFAGLSDPALKAVWENDEDAEYDRL